MTTEYKGRGGKREGSGRPATGRTSKMKRVPNDCPDIQAMLHAVYILRNWKQELETDLKARSSPRNEGVLKLLDEMPECLFIDSDK